MASLNPFKLSVLLMCISSTPRVFKSFNTFIQKDALSFWDSHMPNISSLNNVLPLLDQELSTPNVLELSLRTFHLHDISIIECLKVLSHESTIRESRMHIFSVDLYDKINITFICYLGNRSVLSVNRVSFGFLFGWYYSIEDNMATNR